ncbi:MAG TPA: hypothetical protein VK612_01625 [Pyrinomonadaceae bacterium]|nr:hypothetical protein [Pyrinomonadaceae bacterium]
MTRSKLTTTRDSVAAGDDADAPHERTTEIDPSQTDTLSFIRQTAVGYLPSVNGIGHSWSAILNGRLIASITVTEIQPKLAELTFEPENTLYFRYHSATY